MYKKNLLLWNENPLSYDPLVRNILVTLLCEVSIDREDLSLFGLIGSFLPVVGAQMNKLWVCNSMFCGVRWLWATQTHNFKWNSPRYTAFHKPKANQTNFAYFRVPRGFCVNLAYHRTTITDKMLPAKRMLHTEHTKNISPNLFGFDFVGEKKKAFHRGRTQNCAEWFLRSM